MVGIKEMVVVSGKGGTGKTSIAGALSFLFRNKVVADCDVDAANLHMILRLDEVLATKEFFGGKKAKIDPERCTDCGKCRDVCLYDAVSEDFVIDTVSCEGCGACYFLCPAGAVDFDERLSGYCYVCSTEDNGRFIFAEMLPGEENSGKLVTMVRNEAREEAKKAGNELILIDGPPGIGCPVISSLTGTHLAVIVTEPTPTGAHDLKRIVELTKHFQIRTAVAVNKSDINASYVREAQQFCKDNGLVYLGEIPYEPKITEAQKEAKTILDIAPDCVASGAIRGIHAKLQSILEEL
ncbi:MAG TPA: ATP-binding protein [Syntrophorhabdaceae bacterium]|nr:ATP-binding protein [Syntrophorhabdaceae bacterium]HQM82177.1 ATP-binding protein [Syntrophorhabdaceae bacterium]